MLIFRKRHMLHVHRLQLFHRRCVRIMCRVTLRMSYKNRISTKELLQRLNIKINEFLHQQKMSQMSWTPLTHGKTSLAAHRVNSFKLLAHVNCLMGVVHTTCRTTMLIAMYFGEYPMIGFLSIYLYLVGCGSRALSITASLL